MKLIAFFILAACLHVNATGYGQRVTLSEREVHIEKIFTEIKKQTGFTFLYTSNILANTKRVSVKVINASVNEVLDLALAGQGLEYRIKGEDRLIIIKTKLSKEEKVELTYFQSVPIDVSGRVVDENGKPVPGVTVTVKGTKKQTITNENGEFTIAGVEPSSILTFSSVNMEPFTINVSGQKEILAKLKTKTSELDEVQIIAYGTTTKRLNTGNVSTVKGADIEKQPVTNPLLALQGRVPGMQITQANGLPGTGVVVRIRGQNSISNGNDPLYVIDGVPYTSQLLPSLGLILGNSGGSVGQSNVFGNPLSYINPNNIESIEVLKDADATAIYGSRGANGVLLITTKKGKAGKTKIDINFRKGWGKIASKVDWLNTEQYLIMRNEAFKNDGETPNTSNAPDLLLWDTTRYTDWQKVLIGGTAEYTDLQASISGGNNNTKYLFAYNYHNETTVFPGAFGDPKGSFHFNVNNISSNQKLHVSLTGTYLADHNKLLQTDYSSLVNLSPNAPALHNADGTLNWEVDSTIGFGTWSNPLANQVLKFNSRTTNLISNSVIGYNIRPELEIKCSFGYSNLQTDEVTTTPLSYWEPAYLPYLTNDYRTARFADNNISGWIIEPQVLYSKNLGKGKLSALVGATIQQTRSTGEVLDASGFMTDELMEDIKSATKVTVGSNIKSLYKYNALFTRLNYNLKDKYLINITARRDGTSRFGPDKQFHNFGAAGLAWIFSNEKFIQKNLSFLSFGKLRASYGTTGNDQVGDYRFMDLYQMQNLGIPYQGTNVFVINTLFNPDLTWEETRKLEGGLEMGFFNDRLYFSGSYFRNRSSNQLIGYHLPYTTGFTTVPANQDAKVENSGWELLLTTKIIKGNNINWTSSFNVTFSRNKLVSIGKTAIGIDPRLLGRPLNTIFRYHYLGIDPIGGSYQFDDGYGEPTFRPDTARPKSQFGFDRQPQYYGGFQNSFSYKGFQIDILFQFIKQIGINNLLGNFPGTMGVNQPLSVLERWQKPGDVTNIQRFSQNSSVINNFRDATSSDYGYVNASFIRLKNISLSYQLTDKWSKKIHIDDCRVYLQGQNLLTITDYKAADPETQSLNSLPPLKMFTIGIQIVL